MCPTYKVVCSLGLLAVVSLSTFACVKSHPQIPCESDDNCPKNYVCDSDGVCQASSSVARRTITVTRSGSGEGKISTRNDELSCGEQCSLRVIRGQTVTLNATPSPLSMFVGWSGGCSGAASTCVLTVDADVSVGAEFTKVPFPLTVERGGTGSGTVTSDPGGIDCGSVCQASYSANTRVRLTARPGPHATFAGWSGACGGTANTCEVTMDARKSVRADFEPEQVPLIVAVTGMRTGNGSITTGDGRIDCGNKCSASFDFGSQVKLTAAPDGISQFSGWEGACAGQRSSTCMIQLDEARSVRALFSPAEGTVSVTIDGGGQVTMATGQACAPRCQFEVTSSTVELRANADRDFVFAGWFGDAAMCGSQTSCTLQLPLTFSSNVIARFSLPLSRTLTGAGPIISSVVEYEGELFIAGTRTNADGSHTARVSRHPRLGAADAQPVWDRLFQGGDTIARDIASDGTGKLCVVGKFRGTNVNPGNALTRLDSAGGYDAFVAKYTTDGQLQWAHRLGGPAETAEEEAWAVAATPDGGCVVVGQFSDTMTIGALLPVLQPLTTAGGLDGFVAAYGPAGGLRWSKRLGGMADDQAFDVAIDRNGNVFVTGSFSTEATFDGSSTSLSSRAPVTGFLVGYSSNGAHLWSRAIVDDSSNHSVGYSLAIDERSDEPEEIVVASSFRFTTRPSPDLDVKLSRFLVDGTPGLSVWFGGSGNEHPYGIDVDGRGDIILAGDFSGDLEIAGSTYGGRGATDAFVVKLNSRLEVFWAQTYGGTDDDTIWNVRTAPGNAFYIAGASASPSLELGTEQIAFPPNGGNIVARIGRIGEGCEDAIPVPMQPGTDTVLYFDTTMRRDDTAPSCLYSTKARAGHDIVYAIELDRPGQLQAVTDASFDTILELRRDPCAGNTVAAILQCNDDYLGGMSTNRNSRIDTGQELEPGVYHLFVDAYFDPNSSPAPGGPGTLTIRITP